jgi:membrane associated rhomboid family serine protease
VAWEAHIFGYLAGVLLIGIVGRLADVNEEQAFTKR